MPHLFHDFSAAHFSFYWELKAVAFYAHSKIRWKYLFKMVVKLVCNLYVNTENKTNIPEKVKKISVINNPL